MDAEGRYYQPPLSSDSQIMQIGANIIDQWDADKNPTFIYFANLEFAGVESLPYLSKLSFQPRWTSNTVFGAWLMPSFWMAAQNATAVGTQSATTPAIRFVMTTGTASAIVQSSSSSASSAVVTANTSLTPPSPSLQLVPSTTTYFPAPNTPTTASLPNNGVTPNAPNAKLGIPFVFGATGTVTRSNTTQTYPILTNATFEMQAQAGGASGPWKAYQRWANCTVNTSSVTSTCQPGSAITGTGWGSASIYDPEYMLLDPRTMRFGVWESHGSSTGDTTDFNRGFNETLDRGTNGAFQIVTGMGPLGSSFSGVGGNFPGAQLANNRLATPNYKDLDGVRRAGDALGTGDTSEVFPSNPANSASPNPDRPPVLSRALNTVAELGTVSRDQPWKTLNFTSSDSGDAGLLDAFTIFELNSVFASDLIAGKLSLNTRQPLALEAVLAGITTNTNTGTPLITASQRQNIAAALVTMTSTQPMTNKSELVTRFASDPAVTALGNKEAIEAVMRALSDVGQTRTWNLMFDVIAQTGRYGGDAANLDKFFVEGEKRYWLHLAIDRFTGEVIDRQLEAVRE